MKKIGVLISGGGSNLQSLIDASQAGKIQGKIQLVVSNKEAAYGLERARLSGIKAIYLSPRGLDQKAYDKKLIEIFEKEGLDLIVLAGYLKILGEDLVTKYENRIINIHPSLIPSFAGDGYYGIRVHEEALKYGVKVSGATTHFVSPRTDEGPIIMQEAVQVRPEDRPEDLQAMVLEVEHRILVETVRLFCQDRIQLDGRITRIRGEL